MALALLGAVTIAVSVYPQTGYPYSGSPASSATVRAAKKAVGDVGGEGEAIDGPASARVGHGEAPRDVGVVVEFRPERESGKDSGSG